MVHYPAINLLSEWVQQCKPGLWLNEGGVPLSKVLGFYCSQKDKWSIDFNLVVRPANLDNLFASSLWDYTAE